MSCEEVSKASGVQLGAVLSFSESLREKGLVKVENSETERLLPTEEGRRFLNEGFPEVRAYAAALLLSPVSSLSQEERRVGIPWAHRRGFVKVEGGKLVPLKKPEEPYPPQAWLRKASEGRPLLEKEESELFGRKLISRSVSKTIYLSPLPMAASALSKAKEGGEISAISREMLLGGQWRNARLRPYDVSAQAELPFVSKRHAVSAFRRKISSIFSEMGFEEMEGPEIQTSFWNFDALFQPQDHPARDLADTFYLEGKGGLPQDKELVRRVKAAHLQGWGGAWSGEKASRLVLRTHTTALSARYLYEYCRGNTRPKKYFAIGKVFRNEATDYKHLAEFFQVEGIAAYEGATFCDLLGCLREFYRKLGFRKIRFEPSYFPYTEPSLQVCAYFEKKRQWLELGGAGIFRPEVSIPLCGRHPVLAWGLSLERPLMLLGDMDDIRAFYKSSAGWLRKRKIA